MKDRVQLPQELKIHSSRAHVCERFRILPLLKPSLVFSEAQTKNRRLVPVGITMEKSFRICCVIGLSYVEVAHLTEYQKQGKILLQVHKTIKDVTDYNCCLHTSTE